MISCNCKNFPDYESYNAVTQNEVSNVFPQLGQLNTIKSSPSTVAHVVRLVKRLLGHCPAPVSLHEVCSKTDTAGKNCLKRNVSYAVTSKWWQLLAWLLWTTIL